MFEAAELGRKVAAAAYDAELPKLRAKLLDAHLALRDQSRPVIVIVGGSDGAGKGELVHRLNEWLDPRGVATYAFWSQDHEQAERPPYWPFWQAMPGRGRIGIFFGSWYTAPVIARVYRKMKRSQFDTALDRIVAFEQMLAEDGTVFVKLWLHLPKQEQKQTLKKLERDGRLAPDDWKHFKLYDEFTQVSDRALRHTDTAIAPWQVIEACDRRYVELTAGRLLLSALRSGTPPAVTAKVKPVPAAEISPASESVLDHLDLTRKLAPDEYGRALANLQTKLGRLAWAAHEKKISLVMAFEGWDAAGKGSAIRRVTQAIDPRLYRVVGIAAPTDEERAQHYLWRFWRHLPRAGFMTLFDRSWYGRVLVERVEGFATAPEWSRAYHEINAFEEQLTDHGIVLAKFWLHLSPAEQLRRFKERETVAYKRYKITAEDWRNREKWDAYKRAVDDMVVKCSTDYAPWTLVAGNDKRFARIQILKTVVRRLEAAL